MASARRTPLNPTLRTFGGATRTYQSLAVWESATDNDLVTATAGEVLDCYLDQASYNTSVTLSGATTDASYYRCLRAAAGEGHSGSLLSGFYISCSTDNSPLSLQEGYATVQDLRLKVVNNSSTIRHAIQIVNGGTNHRAIGCIIFDCANAGTAANNGIRLTRPDAIAVNCLIDHSDGPNIVCAAGSGATVYVYNCTSVGSDSQGFNCQSDTAIYSNCLAYNNVGLGFGGAGTSTASLTCASGDTSAPGTGSRVSQTFTFVDAASRDFHLAANDAGALGWGTDLSADSVYAFDDDIHNGVMGGGVAGETCVTWSIGMDTVAVGRVTRNTHTMGLGMHLGTAIGMANAG